MALNTQKQSRKSSTGQGKELADTFLQLNVLNDAADGPQRYVDCVLGGTIASYKTRLFGKSAFLRH